MSNLISLLTLSLQAIQHNLKPNGYVFLYFIYHALVVETVDLFSRK